MFQYFLFTAISILFSAFTAFYFFKFLKFIIYQLYDESSTLVTLMKVSNKNFKKDIKSLKTSVKKLKRKVNKKENDYKLKNEIKNEFNNICNKYDELFHLENIENFENNENNENFENNENNENIEEKENNNSIVFSSEQTEKELLQSFAKTFDLFSAFNPTLLQKPNSVEKYEKASDIFKNLAPLIKMLDPKDKTIITLFENADLKDPNFYESLSSMIRNLSNDCKEKIAKLDDEVSSDESWNDISKEK